MCRMCFWAPGLGPRAYAIIGQGTISRIIESRPEELRLFWKRPQAFPNTKNVGAKRKTALHDTAENLTRVEDILRELGSNLEKLEKQAEVAAQYHALNASATLKQHQLWLLKNKMPRATWPPSAPRAWRPSMPWKQAWPSCATSKLDMESQRQAHYGAGDAVNQAQGQLYEATAEVGKLEAEIRYVLEGRQRVEQRLQQLAEQIAQWQYAQEAAGPELEELCAGAACRCRETGRAAGRAGAKSKPSACPGLEDALRRPAAGQYAAPAGGAGAAADSGTGRRAAQLDRAKPPARYPPGAPAGLSAKRWSARIRFADPAAVQHSMTLTQEAAELAEAA